MKPNQAMRRLLAVAVGAAAMVMIGSATGALGFGGGVGSPGGGGFGGIGGVASMPSAPGLSLSSTMLILSPGAAPQRFRELNMAGRVPADPAKLPKDARIVTLRINGQTVPMALDAEAFRGELHFDPTSDYGRELYHSMLTKPIEVVGDENLRSQIAQVAASPTGSKPIQISGYVFDRLSPYLVLRSVNVAQ
ncbi:MAG TPA: hypothetical protein VEU51_04690 [Candidatus Acidoferrales bacterium]|nr:hypothetical protein [Candidatus Acidoferrales bacterium]